MAIEIEEPTPFENILHYGLLLGAVFQFICIFAVIFIPKSDMDQDGEEDPRETSTSNTNKQTTQQTHHNVNKKSKKERKKNR